MFNILCFQPKLWLMFSTTRRNAMVPSAPLAAAPTTATIAVQVEELVRSSPRSVAALKKQKKLLLSKKLKPRLLRRQKMRRKSALDQFARVAAVVPSLVGSAAPVAFIVPQAHSTVKLPKTATLTMYVQYILSY